MAGISKGAAGEVIAARFLREHGYDIVAVNARSRLGEVDIIATDDTVIAFVEVKTRSEFDRLEAPREAVTREKQEKIKKTAALYLQHHPSALQPRFDVIEVITTENGAPLQAKDVHHLKNAFETGDLRAAF